MLKKKIETPKNKKKLKGRCEYQKLNLLKLPWGHKQTNDKE